VLEIKGEGLRKHRGEDTCLSHVDRKKPFEANRASRGEVSASHQEKKLLTVDRLNNRLAAYGGAKKKTAIGGPRKAP